MPVVNPVHYVKMKHKNIGERWGTLYSFLGLCGRKKTEVKAFQWEAGAPSALYI